MFYQDLGEHAGILVSLVGVFAGVSAFLLWRLLTRMENKLDELYQLCCDCRQELGEGGAVKKAVSFQLSAVSLIKT